jgi:anti-sigma factor RsiW
VNGEGRRFSVTMPDWGQDHLSPEAVVAFVDDELDDGPFLRATRHLDSCPECSTQVAAQGQARSALRSAQCPSLSSSLLNSLFAIPDDTELPGAPAGLAVTSDGQLVSLARPEQPVSLTTDDHSRRLPSRRMRFGAGAAMSGLALGAIAFGASGIASDAPSAAPDNSARGVFDGSVLGGSVVDARLQPRRAPSEDPAEPAPLRPIPVSFLHLLP